MEWPTLQPRKRINGRIVPHHWMVSQSGAPASEGDLSAKQDKRGYILDATVKALVSMEDIGRAITQSQYA